LRVLSLSTVFPTPDDPAFGLFVRARLQHLAALRDEVEVRVVAPIAVLDYSNYRTKLIRFGSAPARRTDGLLDVLHPHWFYPPLGGPTNPFWLYLRLLPMLSALRKEYRFDLIDSHFAFIEGVTAALLARHFDCPFTVTLRGSEPDHALYRYRDQAMRWALTRADRAIGVSEDLRQLAIDHGTPPQRAVTIPNGIDTSVYYPHDRAESRRKHGIEADEPIILSAGYLIERKGHHLAVRALKSIRAGGIPARLLIAGGAGREGAFEPQIRAVVNELGLQEFVQFLGPVPAATLAELMSAADVYCLASNREGWPNVVHEAMSCGAPVVAMSVGGIPQMIPSEAVGYVVPNGNQVELADALQRALHTTWNRDAIREWAHARSWSQVAKEVLREMRAAIAESAKKGKS
jgi:glycosyltransferase involved in cell wall biosynthesis